MEIVSIAFDGSNRSGKGLQIEMLSSYLEKKNIPYLVVRGDGSREKNNVLEKTLPIWWEKMNLQLHSNNNLDEWNIAACKLAEELVHSKKNILPKIIQENNADAGVLLIDRSILSRAVLVSEQIQNFTIDDLYPKYFFEKGKNLTVWDVLPDIIFFLRAPKEVLLSRLNEDDPKYHFRKKIIEEKSDYYNQVIDLFPAIIKSRISIVDATRDPSQMHGEVCKIIEKTIAPFLF
ncbi:MAG: deoxynucleoside kinase [Candidatus Pacebacteria bacterium]|nr:deoxynucleoside kinase [Candidatus Paceibacterota bacterium]